MAFKIISEGVILSKKFYLLMSFEMQVSTYM